MRCDAQLSFVPIGGTLSLVAGAGVPIPSNIIDLLGEGVGVNPTGAGADIIGVAPPGQTLLFGADMGVGLWRPELMIAIGTAVVAVSSTLLKIALQAAPDTGAAGNYQPGTWQDVVSQDNIAAANLTAGAVPARFPWLPVMPQNLNPRYLRLLFSPISNAGVVPGGSFSAGTIACAVVASVRDDQANRNARKNYTVQ